jgi:hypothetical protein
MPSRLFARSKAFFRSLFNPDGIRVQTDTPAFALPEGA